MPNVLGSQVSNEIEGFPLCVNPENIELRDVLCLRLVIIPRQISEVMAEYLFYRNSSYVIFPVGLRH